MTVLAFVILFIGLSGALSTVMTIAWRVQRRTGNSGWVDTVWTFGLGAVGIVSALAPVAHTVITSRQMLVAVVVGVWAARLGLHIGQRTAGIVDDPRYAKLQRGWGEHARYRMFWLLQKQAVVSIPLALSIAIAAQNPAPGLRWQDGLGIAVLFVGIFGEAMADWQLRRFRTNPTHAGQVCNVGFWRWSRHPNYFFEWFGWLAYPLIALDLTGGYPWGWLAFAGPACMYWLLVYVTGIPLLEEHMLETRGDAFRIYQSRTSAFFPFPPQRQAQPVG